MHSVLWLNFQDPLEHRQWQLDGFVLALADERTNYRRHNLLLGVKPGWDLTRPDLLTCM